MRGEVKCHPTAAARRLFVAGATFRYASAAGSGHVRLESVRPHGERLLLRLHGVRDSDAARAYARATLIAPADAIPLAPGEYLDRDLTECDVYDASGRLRGRVERVEHYPASDMLVVGGRLVPMVSAIVREIDVARRRIVIDPPENLLD